MFAALAGVCASSIVSIVIKSAEVHNIDVQPLKAASFIKNLADCKAGGFLDWQSCGETLTTILRTLKEVALQRVTNQPNARIIFEIQPNSSVQSEYGCDNPKLTREELANCGQHKYLVSGTLSGDCTYGKELGGGKHYENRAITESLSFSENGELIIGSYSYYKVSENTYMHRYTDEDGYDNTDTITFTNNGNTYQQISVSQWATCNNYVESILN